MATPAWRTTWECLGVKVGRLELELDIHDDQPPKCTLRVKEPSDELLSDVTAEELDELARVISDGAALLRARGIQVKP